MNFSNTQFRPLPFPQTRESAWAYFEEHGICMAQWAKALNLPAYSVRDVLHEKNKGRRGYAHKAAVALGLKPNPEKIKAKDI